MGNCMHIDVQDPELTNMGKIQIGQQVSNTHELLGAGGYNGNHVLQAQVRLTFEGIKLPQMDTFSASDPFLVLYEIKSGVKTKLGLTEVVVDNNDPKWIQAIDVDYHFETKQNMLIEIYDAEDPKCISELEKQDFIGSLDFTLGQIVTSVTGDFLGKLEGKHSKSDTRIKITAMEKKAGYGSKIATFGIEYAYTNQKDSLFIVVNKMRNLKNVQPVFKTECKQATGGKYVFSDIEIDTDTLFDDDEDQECLIQAFKWKLDGNHRKICATRINYETFKSLNRQEMRLISHNGDLNITNAHIQPRVTFLDYIFGGCEINVHIAIDFTQSNGQPKEPSSLHYMGRNGKNQYTDAIKSVLNILKDYNSDLLFPTYGFGGILPERLEDRIASHCFALNGNIYDPECKGVNGVLNVYQNFLKKGNLYGPTIFSKIIKHINALCKHTEEEISQNNQTYQILLILTDGAICDLQETIDEIVLGSGLPLSIIIVGVGSANYDMMNVLDGDDEPLYSNKLQKQRERDIVQFVPYRDFKNGEDLTKKVLEEVPRQLTDYFKSKNIKPNPRKHNNEQDLKDDQKMKAEETSDNLDYYNVRKIDMINKCKRNPQLYNEKDVIEQLEGNGIPEEDVWWVQKRNQAQSNQKIGTKRG